jgi:hypothetical protein
MTKPEYPHVLLVKAHEPLTGTWEKDRVILEKAAQQPTLANEYYKPRQHCRDLCQDGGSGAWSSQAGLTGARHACHAFASWLVY